MSTEKEIKSENFSDRLRKARKLKGWGQEQLASKLDVSTGAVGHWEIGPKLPTAENLGKIAALLDVSTRWLLYGQENANLGNARSAEPIQESSPMYRVDVDTVGAPEEDATKAKCREHLDRFLASCSTRSQIGWTYCELQDKFPLNKFKREEEP